MPDRRRGARAELVLSAAVLALGFFAAAVAFRLPDAGGYSRIGPNVMPVIVAGGLVFCGAWLLVEWATGGWRAPVADDPAERGEHAFDTRAFTWVVAGLLAQMALIRHGGFVVAAATLFGCVARGFGSARPIGDAAIGFGLALALYLFFARFLGVSLPGGWLAPLLSAGAA